MRCLNSFHNCCVRTILGITTYQQWEQKLTPNTLANRFDTDWTVLDIIKDKRLWRLSHLGHRVMRDYQRGCFLEIEEKRGHAMGLRRDGETRCQGTCRCWG